MLQGIGRNENRTSLVSSLSANAGGGVVTNKKNDPHPHLPAPLFSSSILPSDLLYDFVERRSKRVERTAVDEKSETIPSNENNNNDGGNEKTKTVVLFRGR